MTTRIREVKILRPIFALRDIIWEKTGLFDLKKKIKQKMFYKRLMREDSQKKVDIAKLIMQLPESLIGTDFQADDFVFSLTSYGVRVEDTLPYALYSIINQKLPPKKIVVYLDWDNWSNEKLPILLQHLKRVGVDFRYCKDIKSYKKLIPALKDFPNNPIITLDDDFYYNPNYHTWMREAYDASDKHTVLGQWGCIPQRQDGRFLPYSQWKDCKYGDEKSEISFFGCCCCYPPHIFDDEIINEAIFMKLCPTADDIWFWAMEERLGIKRAYIQPWGYGYNTPVNRIEEYDWNQQGTLMYQNVVQGKNDMQLKSVVDYYKLDLIS